ncbi:MAG: ABC transporter permease [Bacilli bacterium]|nr:ABC transporter permease [Bacilli bacterium]
MAREHKEPLFHIVKRMNMGGTSKVAIRIVSILIGLIIGAIFVVALSPTSHNFFGFFGSMVSGISSTPRRLWLFLLEGSLLLGVSIALVPAFKMKFWNLGGNGQILVGCLATCAVMFYLGGKLPDPALWPIMLVASVLAGAIWALIPALFKAFFKTNESLFTLMLNYIAAILIGYFISLWYPTGTGSMSPLPHGALPTLGNTPFGKYFLPTIIFFIVAIAIYFYLRFSKHGYELSVVGESENTARYIGINVKVVTIRTMILSGALCGLVGFILSGAVHQMMSVNMDSNMGFTGIMVAWLSHFNPAVMILIAYFVTFVTRGMSQVNTDFGFTDEKLSSVISGIIFFLLIASEFFVSYRIVWRADIQKVMDKIAYPFVKACDSTDSLIKTIKVKLTTKKQPAKKEAE